MAAKKQYRRLAFPGYSSRKEYHVPQYEYDEFFNYHVGELAAELEHLGFKVTPSRERALGRMKVNKIHNYPKPSGWNQYVSENVRGVMETYGIPFQDAIGILADEWKAAHPKPPKRPKQVAAGISGGASRPRRRMPLRRM